MRGAIVKGGMRNGMDYGIKYGMVFFCTECTQMGLVFLLIVIFL